MEVGGRGGVVMCVERGGGRRLNLAQGGELGGGEGVRWVM